MATINSNTHDYFSRNIEQMWQPCQTPLLVSNHSVIPFAILKSLLAIIEIACADLLSGKLSLQHQLAYWIPIRAMTYTYRDLQPADHFYPHSPFWLSGQLSLWWYNITEHWTCCQKFPVPGLLTTFELEQVTLNLFLVSKILLFNPIWKPNEMVYLKIIN